jgi:hypothetical protein
MIAIESNDIIRDGELIGRIVGNDAYLLKKQGGVIIGQIKKAAGIDLDFDVVETLPEPLPPPPIPAESEVLHVFPSDDPAAEAVSASDDAGAATVFDTSTFGSYEENPRYFQQCFVNTYGPHGFNEWLKQNGK